MEGSRRPLMSAVSMERCVPSDGHVSTLRRLCHVEAERALGGGGEGNGHGQRSQRAERCREANHAGCLLAGCCCRAFVDEVVETKVGK